MKNKLLYNYARIMKLRNGNSLIKWINVVDYFLSSFDQNQIENMFINSTWLD